jgi:murein hydrolase activator
VAPLPEVRALHLADGDLSHLATGIGLVVVLIALVAAGPAAAQRRDLQGEQRKLQQTQRQLREQRDKAEEARRREGSVLADLEKVGRRLSEKQREVARLDTRVKRVQTEVTTLRAEIKTLEGSRQAQERALARRLRTLYKVHAQGGAVPLILSDQDPVGRAVAVRHLVSLAALDARLIEEYRDTSEQLDDRRSRGEARQRELTELRTAVQREQAEADREAAMRRGLLAKVRDERAYHERMVGELMEASRRLEAFVRELQAKQRQLARAAPPRAAIKAPVVGPPAGFRGRLPWPTDGRIAAPFGAQVHPRFGTRTFRNGVEIEAPDGKAVQAVLAGQAIYTGWFKGYGNLVIIDHGQELYTLYAHVLDIEVREGEDVRQGQRIGTVGDTGSPAGPRLYFEVRYQGRAQDPEQWLRQRG